jgi:branched-chain amino acid aminotransferase
LNQATRLKNNIEKELKVFFFFAERKDPESKVINHKLRSSIYHKLIHDGGYEALLVNENNQITEGSRSNVFFMKGDTLFTAPDSAVLNGITRKHILEICSENNIRVDFLCVNAEEITQYDAVFMTGTSPSVLPFYCIDNKLFNVKIPMIERLRNLYLQKAEASIDLFRPE